MVSSVLLSQREDGWQVVNWGGIYVRYGGVRGGETAVGRKGIQGCCASTGNVREGNGHKKSNGRPIAIAMIQTALVFIKGVGLNIGIGIPLQRYLHNLPGGNISNAAKGVKPTEHNGIAAKKYMVLPGAGVRGNPILDTRLVTFQLDICDGHVVDPATPAMSPAPVESLFIKDTRRYFIAERVVDRVGTIPSVATGREPVTALMKGGGGHTRCGWDIAVDGGRGVPTTREGVGVGGVGRGGGLIWDGRERGIGWGRRLHEGGKRDRRNRQDSRPTRSQEGKVGEVITRSVFE